MVVSDVRPMRAFGIGCGAGVLICWVTSLTLVPAVVALWPGHKGTHATELGAVGNALCALWERARRARRLVIVAALALGAATVGPMLRVAVRMEPRAFFRVGSEPWLAEQFLEERFGGAHFVQVALTGDFNDPATLRELARLEDYTRSLDRVTQVQAVTGPLKLVNNAMSNKKRLPSTAAQASNLYFFLEGEAGMRALLGPDRKEALVTVRVRGDAAPVVDALERFVGHELRARPSWPTAEDVSDRVAWRARAALHGGRPDLTRLRRAVQVLALPGELDEQWAARRAQLVRDYFTGVEAPPVAESERARLERLAVEGSPELEAAFKQAAPSPEEGALAFADLTTRLTDERRALGVERATPLVLEAAGLSGAAASDPELTESVADTLDDLFLPRPSTHAALELGGRVAGEPILDRGFSRSVERNQTRSLIVAIVVVLGLLYGLFRSVGMAALCMWPSLLTMAVIFGVMGLLGKHIDLGTSLVAGIATGAGSDFAMHYMWYLRRQRPDDVSRTVGPVMVVGVLLVALGFFVLALGKSPVMQLFGTLAGLGMSLSALFTCLLIPAVLNRVGSEMESPSASSKIEEAIK
jgi:predicted RND superfamily exporter protein